MVYRPSQRINIFYCFLVLLFSFGCKKTTKIETTLFNTEGLQVGIKEAEWQGFSVMSGGDVYGLEKRNKDTLVILYPDPDYDMIMTKTWEVKIESTKVAYIETFFKDRNCTLSESFYKHYPTNYWCWFYAFSEVDNATYICRVNDIDGVYYIEIYYYVPLLDKEKLAHKIKFKDAR